jgi:hypothetical protein
LRNVQLTHRSTLMYIEAEAKMDSYQAQDGSQRTALNLLQRKFRGASRINRIFLTLRQATLRHSQDRASRTVVPRATPTLPASLSAALALLEERHVRCKKVYDNSKNRVGQARSRRALWRSWWVSIQYSVLPILYSYAFFCINIGYYRNEGPCDLASASMACPWCRKDSEMLPL